MNFVLNQGQEQASNAFFEFLFSDEKEFNISGPGGVGKTYLMSQMIDEVMPKYFEMCKIMGQEPEFTECVMTATTNPAAQQLAKGTNRPTKTIHSFMNLKVVDDYSTGVSRISKIPNRWEVYNNKVIFIDECSMEDTPLDQMIQEGTINCKIVYVGDHCQLAPVMEPISPIYRRQMPFFELTEPMRTTIPELQALNHQLREQVKSGVFSPIKLVPGVIDHLDDQQMQDMIAKTFPQHVDPPARIAAWSNRRVTEFNDHIRSLRGLPAHPTIGEKLVNNSAIELAKTMLSVQEQVTITKIGNPQMIDIEPGVQLQVRMASLVSSLGSIFNDVPLVEDRDHYNALGKYYAGQRNWNRKYFLKNKFPDLRPLDSSTVHKLQGSTHDIMFVDVGNISTCHNADQVARLLYVAVSRAKSRVYFYGNLAEKYGGLTY